MPSIDDLIVILYALLFFAPPIIVIVAISIFLVRLNLRFARNTLICWALCACFIAIVFFMSYQTPLGFHCDFAKFWYRGNLSDGSLRIAIFYDHWKPNEMIGFHRIGAFPSDHDDMPIGSASSQIYGTHRFRLDYVAIPIWVFAYAATGIATLIAMWVTFRRRPDPALCPNCKYDISACTSDRCPECGQQLPSSTVT